MRPVIVAGVGGLVLGHILWLIAIAGATRSAAASSWVLLISTLVLIAAGGAGYLAWQNYQRKDYVRAAFLAVLPLSPMIFTTIVLGVTYL